jgi:hypothetical protein
LYAERRFESHSFFPGALVLEPLRPRHASVQRAEDEGHGDLASFFASGLGVDGESGVSRCTRSNSPPESRAPNRFHTSRSKKVGERRHRGHDGPALVGSAAQDLGRLVDRRRDGLRVDRGERLFPETRAQDRVPVPDLRDEVDVGDLRERPAATSRAAHADPFRVGGFGDQEDARPRRLRPQLSPSSRDFASAIPCLRR